VQDFAHGDRWVAVVCSGLILVSLYLPHKYLHGKSRENFRQALVDYHTVLRDMALKVQELKIRFHLSEVVIGADAQVEVEPDVFHQDWPVSGPSVVGIPSVSRSREGGFQKRSMEYAF